MASTRTFVASSADRAWAHVASASLDLISAASRAFPRIEQSVRAASACCWDRSRSARSSSAAIFRACGDGVGFPTLVRRLGLAQSRGGGGRVLPQLIF